VYTSIGRSSLNRRGAWWLGHALLVPVWLGVLALLTVVAAHVFAFDDRHGLMLANAYTLWLLVPAYTVVVAALLFRAWPLALVAGVVVVAHLAWVVPPLFRTVPVSAAAARAPHVRVVSANLRFTNSDHAPTLHELAHFDADVIVLEEVTPEWWDAIAHSPLRTSHPVIAREVRDDPGGMVVLSRRPLRDVHVRHAGGWPIITASLVVGERRVHLAGVHVPAPLETFELNQRARRDVNTIARRLPHPRLLAGDFNATPYNQWHQQLLGLGLRDAHEAVGRPLATTWQNDRLPLPPLLLDHVYVDAPIVPLQVREGRAFGSDHRPIVVDLAVLPAPRTKSP
jgi:endonuclease/exonuclease/phosphatase (EEP) superfamily protein YafD